MHIIIQPHHQLLNFRELCYLDEEIDQLKFLLLLDLLLR